MLICGMVEILNPHETRLTYYDYLSDFDGVCPIHPRPPKFQYRVWVRTGFPGELKNTARELCYETATVVTGAPKHNVTILIRVPPLRCVKFEPNPTVIKVPRYP